MINALKKLNRAKANYNSTTGEGANDYLKALLTYLDKSREVEIALNKVQEILGGNKK